MTPDPSREWYVYFKEQEMGPFSESDLRTRVEVGELDNSAFVFTEGMSDWTALEDVDFLTKIAISQVAPGVVESRTADTEPARNSTARDGVAGSEKVGIDDAKSDLEQRLDEETRARKAARRPAMLKWALLGFVMLLVVGFVVDYANKVPHLKTTADSRREQSVDDMPAPSTPSTGPVKATSANPSADIATNTVIWGELASLRLSQDRQGPPFRLSSVFFSPDRPILTGSVSSLIKTDRIHVVVYPDLAKSLMERPHLWWFDVSLVDGYFAIGPLSIDGKSLPPGTYKLMAQALGRYMGTVSFDVGRYPTGPDLEVQMKALQNQRAMGANEELKGLEQLFRDFDGLYEALKRDAVRFAIRGAARRANWTAAMQPWTEAYSKTFGQFADQSALTYYPELRTRLESFSKEMIKVQGLMDFYSLNGRAGFEKRAGRRYDQIWNSLQKDHDYLKSEFLAQTSQTQTEATLNEDQLKNRLLEKR